MKTILFSILLAEVIAAQTPPSLDERGIHVDTTQPSRQKLEFPKRSVIVPRGLALIVGIAAYGMLDEKQNLRFSERDAELMQTVLTSSTGGNFQAENVKLLIGPNATLESFRRTFEEWLAKSALPEDRVVVYFAGHGILGPDKKGYLALYDFDRERPVETGYSMDRFAEVFRQQIAAKRKVVFIDACHTGLVSRDLGGVSDAVSDLNGGEGMLTFAASHGNQAAYEDTQLQHGIFTYYIVKALRGQADRNEDGVVSTAELVDYVKGHVVDHTVQRGARQTPRENQGFPDDLILGFNASKSRTGVELSDAIVIVQSNMDQVEFFMDGVSRGTVNRNSPLPLPGIKPGDHIVRATKMGYEPDGPRVITVYPGGETTVTIRIQFARVRKKSAELLFEKGLKDYNEIGHPKSYQLTAPFADNAERQVRRAIKSFQEALQDDPKYSDAALYLGHAYRMVFDIEAAERYYRLALDLDPANVEARIGYGAMLTDAGNTDGAAREFLQARERDPNNDRIYSSLAYTYRLANNFDFAADTARKAIALNASNANAHFTLGDCLRYMRKFQEAATEYTEYLRLSDFDPNPYLKAFLYLVSPTSTSRNASRKSVYRDRKNQALLGLCICEQNLNNYNVATQYCRKALDYDPKDAFCYFHLGWINLLQYNATLHRQHLIAAKVHFLKMIEINPDLEESGRARQYLEQINSVLKQPVSAQRNG